MTLSRTRTTTPVGELTLIGGDAGIRAILWPIERDRRVVIDDQIADRSHPILEAAAAQLDEYFDGTRTTFDLPLDPRGTTFQNDVWRTLLAIDFGATTSYGKLAAMLGKPTAARAIGAAVGRNPISIVIPCHRVVGANGKLTGFAGGLATKSHLLTLEHPKFPRLSTDVGAQSRKFA